MSIKIAVNLPVKDLAHSTRFFAELGFPADTRLANDNMQACIISDDIYVLLVDQSQFKAITRKEIPDTTATSEVILQLQVESRQRLRGGCPARKRAERPRLPVRKKLSRPRRTPLGRLLHRPRHPVHADVIHEARG
jgi:hypothetical protein